MRRAETTKMDLTVLADPTDELCECLPLSTLKPGQERQTGEDYLPMTPVTPELGAYLREVLAGYFPRSSPLSVLLLHITQLEQVHISPKSSVLHRRHRFHAHASFMEQVLANVGRTIRGSDPMIVHGGAGAAIIFPDVDQEGAFSIVERAFHSINLLQPETVIPPLARETDIFLGIGSYPKPANSFDELLHFTSCVAHRLTLRPAVSAHIQRLMPCGNKAVLQGLTPTGNEAAPLHVASADQNGIPFMQLPAKLPARLKHLIPYHLARELRCVPVGRDHNRLTVAMARAADSHTLDLLKETTGMAIYPVACEIGALDALLANEW